MLQMPSMRGPSGSDETVESLADSFAFDDTELGPKADWPYELTSCLALCLSMSTPCSVFLGPKHRILYNDAYRQVAGSKHPHSWGEPVAAVYAEQAEIPAEVAKVYATGVPCGRLSMRFETENDKQASFATENYFDWSLGPIRDPRGNIIAVFNIASDVTNQVLLDRRTKTLAHLATRAARGMSIEGCVHSMIAGLEGNPDVGWMAVYVKNDTQSKQDMDYADQMAGDGFAKSLARHNEPERHPFRLVGTSFDEDLVRHSYSSAGGSFDDHDRHDAHSSSRAEGWFEPGTSKRNLPDWLPHLPDQIHVRPFFRQHGADPATAELVSAVAEIILDAPLADDTRSEPSAGSASTGQSPKEWPFEKLALDQPHVILANASGTSKLAESIMIAVTTLSPQTGHTQVLGVVIAGLNENRKIDAAYLSFFQQITYQFETALLNGKAREADRRAATAIKKLNNDRVKFFQNTAHELRTPLTLMLGPLEELVKAHTAESAAATNAFVPVKKAPPPAVTLSRLSLISRNARRLLKLVNSILRFSSIEAGKLDTRFERQPTFGMVTRHLAECFEPLAEQGGVQLVFEDALALTEAGDETVFDKMTVDRMKQDVFIDLDLWEQVIFNTLSNAFKNTWKGTITVSLSESTRDDQEGFLLGIADTGIGIAQDQLELIFERYYRADNSEARSAEGTGIGLSLVRELVRLHGGTISAASELGKGTSFTVWIPRGLDHLPHDRVFATADPGPAEAEALQRLGGQPAVSGTEAAKDRWNAKARGVERAALLEQMNTLMSETSSQSRVSRPGLSSARPRAEAAMLSPVPDQSSAPVSASAFAVDSIPSPLRFVPSPEQAGFGQGHALRRQSATTAQSSAKVRSGASVSGSTRWYSKGWWSDRTDSPTSSAPSPASRQQPSLRQQPSRPALMSVPSGLPPLDPSDRPRVLIVDDNLDMRTWITSILQTDYSIIEARNGQEALDLLETVTPDLVLSDVNMPLVNGLSLVRQLRSDNRISQIPVILLSARSGQEDSIEGLDAGAADYLTKPFNVRDLVARCRVHVRLNRLRLKVRESEHDALVQRSRAEAKNSLLSLVSHELRTPLQTIQGAADLLGHSPDVPVDLIEAISAGAGTLSSRIDQLIDVAHVGSSKFQLTMDSFDLDSALTAALALHTPAAAKKGVNMFTIVGRAPRQVTSDQERLTQVLDVLLANAVKFTSAGEIVVRVWIENADGDELKVYEPGEVFLCFAVSDSGAGIPPELAEAIFQPFSLADSSSTRTHGGAGLGLTLALRLVELAGGHLAVESKLGQGSEFQCRWPMRMDGDAARHDPHPPPEPIIVPVSSSESVVQSLLCTAATFNWPTREQVDAIPAAESLLSAHTGHHPLIFFVDERVLEAEPAATKQLLDRLAVMRTPAQAELSLPGTRSYAVVVSLTGSSLDEFAFHGAVTPPFYRTHVKAVVEDVLAQRRQASTHFSKLKRALDPTTAAPLSPGPRSATEQGGNPFPHGRLLVAEDNKLNARLLIRQLQMLGFHADEAEHGLRVLDLIKDENTPMPSPDAPHGSPLVLFPPYAGILMDLDMPQMDGFEATRRVRAMGGRFSHLPVLAVSANGSPDIRERVAAAGMDDFLSKPVVIAQLTALLKRNGLIRVSLPSSPTLASPTPLATALAPAAEQ